MIQVMLRDIILNDDDGVVAQDSRLSVAEGKGRVFILAASLLD
jgi:hypothetical protein